MPNIASVLKAEVTRLARKELRSETEVLKKTVAAQRADIGLMGAMQFAEMPEELPKRGDGPPLMTCAIASSEDLRSSEEEQWIWQMRPHIAEGLAASAIV